MKVLTLDRWINNGPSHIQVIVLDPWKQKGRVKILKIEISSSLYAVDTGLRIILEVFRW